MNENPSGEQAAAAALAHLLADHPELGSVTWSVGETPGVLSGRQISESGHGEIIDACAAAMGGTVARTTQTRHGEGAGFAQLATVYDGVPVQVWVSYLVPGPNGLTSTELRNLLGHRPLGTLPILPGGAS